MKEAENIEIDGVKIEDLYLDFTLPGDSKYELKVKKKCLHWIVYRHVYSFNNYSPMAAKYQ